MNFYPSFYLNNVKEISYNLLKENNIKGLILDVDNTLIDIEKRILDGAKEWCEGLKEHGIKICILSNTNKKDKVEKVAKELDIPYIYFAKKPFKAGFYKAKGILNIDTSEEIAVVGDQIFTDIIGANRVNMKSVLVKPVDERDYWYTAIKRPIEGIFLKKIIRRINGE